MTFFVWQLVGEVSLSQLEPRPQECLVLPFMLLDLSMWISWTSQPGAIPAEATLDQPHFSSPGWLQSHREWAHIQKVRYINSISWYSRVTKLQSHIVEGWGGSREKWRIVVVFHHLAYPLHGAAIYIRQLNTCDAIRRRSDTEQMPATYGILLLFLKCMQNV